MVPSGQDSSILPTWVANHGTGFDSSCLLTELASLIIRCNISNVYILVIRLNGHEMIY